MSRLYVSSSTLLYCNYDQTIVYFTEELGLAFVATFAFQLILAAEQVRVTPYEGALSSGIFGQKPTSTFCASLITCCAKTPVYNFEIVDEGEAAGDDKGPKQAASKRGNDSMIKGGGSKKTEMSVLMQSPGNDRTGLGEP